MSDQGYQVPVVIYPRFTTLFSSVTFEGYAIDVSAYERANLNLWTSPVGGTGGALAVTFSFMESVDRLTWNLFPAVPPLTPTAGVETSQSLKFTKRWFRVNTVLTGTQPIVALWMEGFLVKRLK
jgi:hypothetical protein